MCDTSGVIFNKLWLCYIRVVLVYNLHWDREMAMIDTTTNIIELSKKVSSPSLPAKCIYEIFHYFYLDLVRYGSFRSVSLSYVMLG